MKTSTRLIMGAGFYRIGQIPAYMLSECTIAAAENENPPDVQSTPRRMMYAPFQVDSINFDVLKNYIKTY